MSRLLIILLTLCCSACGYLDEELLVDDATFEEGFGVGGLGLSGIGTSSGCGGFGYASGHGFLGHRLVRRGAVVQLADTSIRVSMTDAQVLDQTDIDVIDESEGTRRANTAEQFYYSQLAARDEALAETY